MTHTPSPKPLKSVPHSAQPEFVPERGGDDAGTWTVVVPVKPSGVGKSRLADAGPDRAELARAVALDTIAAAAAATRVAEVVVVTDDAELTAALAAVAHTRVVAEAGHSEPGASGLDAAIAIGIRSAAPGQHAALLGDLPALRPEDLDAALEAAQAVERGLVPDAEGTGSTLITARAGAVWFSAFGEDSAERHRLLGCVDLGVPDDSTLRRDVDTAEQLAAASALGLGPHTAAVLAE